MDSTTPAASPDTPVPSPQGKAVSGKSEPQSADDVKKHGSPPVQPPSRRALLIVGTLILVIVAGALGFYLHRRGVAAAEAKRKAAEPPPAIPVSATVVEQRDIPVYLDGLGTVQAYNTVTVRAQVDGQLVEINFKEGQDVKRGELLARIDPRTFQAQLDQARGKKAQDEADLNNARINLGRLLEVGEAVTKQSVSDQRALIAKNEAAIESDEALIKFQQTMLSYTYITSPIAGRTGVRLVDVGNIVHATDQTGIVVVTQLRPISVIFTLPQQHLQKIATRMKQAALPVIALDGDGQTELDRGTLELVDNQIDQTTGTIRLKATFTNENNRLWPGGFVNVRLLVDTRHNALVVDAPAVQEGPDGNFVFEIDSAQTVTVRPVHIEMIQDNKAVLSSGVHAGEQVVLIGQERLKPGVKVAIGGSKSNKNGEAVNVSSPAAPEKPR
jgi:multidrug efflux system membrane fusion protein